jgi:hypothetical protein
LRRAAFFNDHRFRVPCENHVTVTTVALSRILPHTR